MKLFKLISLMILAAFVTSTAFADDGRFSEVTAKIISLKHDNAFPTAHGEAVYEYGCAENLLRVDKTWIPTADRPGAQKPAVEVRVVLLKNNYIRCLWQNPKTAVAKFNINNMVPADLIAVQPAPPQPPVPPTPITGIEITESISVVLLSSQYQEVTSQLQKSLDKGYIKISNIDAQRSSGRQTLVKIKVQQVTPYRYMRRNVKELGTIIFYLSQPPGHPSFMIGPVEFIPSE